MSPSERSEEPYSRGRCKHGAIPVIGLIGGIGSGKSSVASLMTVRGASVIDADAVGHELLGEPEIRARIVEQFGEGVLEGPPGDRDGSLRIDRRALGKIVFADPSERRALEAILHPPMRARFLRDIEALVRAGASGPVVLDAAILLEAGWDDLCDRVVFVDAPRPERLRRVKEARGWSEEAFEARERSQWPCDEKRSRADWIIPNHTGRDRLIPEVDLVMSRLLHEPAVPADASFGPRHGNTAGPSGDAIPNESILGAPTPAGRMS
ncbi:MAG: dephospho-CoA kinase [Isosphaeraceae bacterium]